MITAGLRKPTLLCVDDNQTALHIRKLVLEGAGYSVLVASDSATAMEIFSGSAIDMVVSDHFLQDGTGTELAAAMKKLKPDVPIAIISGLMEAPEGTEHADLFICKTDPPPQVLRKISELLDRRRIPGLPTVENPFSTDSQRLQLLAAIVDSSDDAIFSKTLDGTILSWNKAAEKTYGYRAEEIIGRSVAMLVPAERRDEVHTILERLRAGEKVDHFETVRVAKNGRRLDVALTISPMRDGQGHLVGASTIARDITEQKKAEEALRKAEKLALAGRMAATVAHEINNPLDCIGNILHLLRNAVELNTDARKYVDAAQDELNRVSEITKLTLGMQRGAADHRESVPVTNVLENVLTLYRRKMRAIGIEVERRYNYEGAVVGFSGELRQVFSNLIVNAMDALAMSGDKLVLRVRRARRWDSGEQGVRVSILDNGPGIAPEHRPKLFQAFYTTKGDQGTGIGLSVSNTIVKNHGGTLRWRSSVRMGRTGTCFSVFLPTGDLQRTGAA